MTAAPPTQSTVLFVCVSNAGKSVIAQGLMRHVATPQITALSAGTRAKGAGNDMCAKVMAEMGIDVTAHQPTQLTDALISEADLVVVVGTQAQVESVGDTPVEVWDVDEPSSRGIDGIERMRLVRDDIAGRVTSLVTRLAGPDPA